MTGSQPANNHEIYTNPLPRSKTCSCPSLCRISPLETSLSPTPCVPRYLPSPLSHCHPCQFTPLCFTLTFIPPEPFKPTLSVCSAIPRLFSSIVFLLRSPRLQSSFLSQATASYSMREWYPPPEISSIPSCWTLRSPCVSQVMDIYCISEVKGIESQVVVY